MSPTDDIVVVTAQHAYGDATDGATSTISEGLRGMRTERQP
ncbi:hypothetical protein [Natrinema sp. HArc-T2]